MLEPLLDIALDLTAHLAAEDRYRHLLSAVRRMVPCDAAALLRLDNGVLVPLATDGLAPEVGGRRFVPAEHPRLARILESPGPVRFEVADADLPDPFDGLLADRHDALERVHACMGCALRVEGEVVGALTTDAHDPRAFDRVDLAALATFAALAGAAIRTARLFEALEEAARHQGLVARQLLRSEQARRGGEILGVSQPARRLRAEVELLSGSDLPVLITGETGAGKEVVARSIHDRSRRRDRALIYVNCAALPETIAESELFGHVRGAFTGASENRAGKFEAADHGTLFLDEVGELPMTVQPKLLRALQSGEVQRVGADKPLRVDVRVLAATNRNLPEEVAAGRFRADLFHRLSVYPLEVPPLRARREDIALLAGYFLDEARARLGLGAVRLTPDAEAALTGAEWPGNVRELEHAVLRAALRASGGRRRETVVLDAAHLDLPAAGGGSAAAPAQATTGVSVPALQSELPLAEAVDAFRRAYIRRHLDAAGGSWAETARRLGLDRGNLHRLAGKLGLRG